jgi:hypothetical protein
VGASQARTGIERHHEAKSLRGELPGWTDHRRHRRCGLRTVELQRIWTGVLESADNLGDADDIGESAETYESHGLLT